MSFGDHLEELRGRLLKSLAGIILFFLLGLFFQDALISLISRPHRRAMETLEANQDPGDIRRYMGPSGWIPYVKGLNITHDLEKCRRSEPEDPVEKEKFKKILEAQKRFRDLEYTSGSTLVATRYPEAFLTGIKAAFIFALLVGAPWTLYQLWMFVSAGLYRHEKKYVGLFLPVSMILFVIGALFGYFVLIPFGLYFLGGYGNPGAVSIMFTLSEYFSLFITLTFALGVVFQLPLIMVALSLIGIVTSETFSSKRKYFILAAFVFGALLTPPDPITQLLMAGPILALFEVGIWGTRIVEKAARGARAE